MNRLAIVPAAQDGRAEEVLAVAQLEGRPFGQHCAEVEGDAGGPGRVEDDDVRAVGFVEVRANEDAGLEWWSGGVLGGNVEAGGGLPFAEGEICAVEVEGAEGGAKVMIAVPGITSRSRNGAEADGSVEPGKGVVGEGHICPPLHGDRAFGEVVALNDDGAVGGVVPQLEVLAAAAGRVPTVVLLEGDSIGGAVAADEVVGVV
jgi:hypothetical protein